jgi:hypothetical protein
MARGWFCLRARRGAEIVDPAMPEPGRGPSALPPPLLLGLVLTAAYFVAGVVAHLQHGRPAGFELAATSGLSLIGNVLLAFGLPVLADRHAGQVRRGLRVAAIGWIATLLLRILGELAFGFGVTGVVTSFVLQYGSFAAMLGVTIGLAIALWRDHAPLAAATVMVWVASALAATFSHELAAGLGHDNEAVWVLQLVFWVMRLALLIALAFALAGASVPGAAAPTASDLRRVARALRFATGAMAAALVALSPCMQGRDPSLTVLRCLCVALGAAALAGLGLALLGAARDRDAMLAPVPVALFGTLAVWCGRMLIAILPEVASQRLDRPWYSGRPYALSTTLLTVPGLVMIGSAVLAATIGVFARRRALGELRCRAVHHATSALIASVVTPLVAVELYSYGDSPALEALVILVVCVTQLALLARLCDHAVRAVDHGPALPAARVVRV